MGSEGDDALKLVKRLVSDLHRDVLDERETLVQLSAINKGLLSSSKNEIMAISNDPAFKRSMDVIGERHKGNYDVQIVLGNVLFALGLNEEAIESYARALAVRRTREALNNLGVATSRGEGGKESIRYFKEALEMSPRHGQTWFNLGKAYFRMDLVEEALDSFKKVVDIDPRNKSAWNNIGVCYRRTDRLEDALDAYDKALAIDGRYVWALDNRGVVLMEMGRYGEALESIEQALRIDPSYEPAILNRRQCMKSLKKRGKLRHAKAAQR